MLLPNRSRVITGLGSSRLMMLIGALLTIVELGAK